ncbi:MAG: efflux RND transporter periplasmic adaptor subunit [Xenococcaceae cyanobacterium MO_234.B1]|nr:efflux RND transporter periplasmic adaptor subunit [Xenococcaceae cyanobacterium MO_234.B1]
MIKKKKPSTWFSQKLLGAVIILPLLVSGCGSKEAEEPEVKAIPVKLQTLESETLIDSSRYVGTLEARGRVNVAPRIDGRIIKIFVQQGERVRRGQPLIELYPTQEQESVNAATQNINVEKANLMQAQAQLRTAEADRARTAAEVERARADVQDLEAEVTLARINIRRSKYLVAGGALPDQSLDDTTRDLETNIAKLEARRESLNASIKALEAADRRVEQNLALVDSQKASVARAEGELGAIQQDLVYNTITAPIDGVIGNFNVKKVGDTVDLGEIITTLTDNEIFYLNVGIPTEYRSQMKLGLPVKIINGDGSDGITGEVTYIEPVIDQNSQTMLTKVTFKNDGSLRDREYVQVKVIWDEKPGLLVPTRAISTVGANKFVFVATPGEGESGELVVKQKPLKLGTIQGQAYQVISGVEEGDRIAVSRILDLKDGTPITEATLTSEQPLEQ